jgi:Zn ribbon nucleic-acid-binding protein
MGNKCPECARQTFHNKGAYRRCKGCRVIGWPWHQRVKQIGSGAGTKCPWCEQQTLHQIFGTKRMAVRRCSTCSFTTVRSLTPTK